MNNDIYSTDSARYLGNAIDFAVRGDFFFTRLALMDAMNAAGENEHILFEEAVSWAKALPTLAEVIRLNRHRWED